MFSLFFLTNGKPTALKKTTKQTTAKLPEGWTMKRIGAKEKKKEKKEREKKEQRP